MSRHTENELCRGVFRLIETLQPGGTDIFAQSAVYAVGALAEMDASDDQLRMAAIYSHLWPLRGIEVTEELKT